MTTKHQVSDCPSLGPAALDARVRGHDNVGGLLPLATSDGVMPAEGLAGKRPGSDKGRPRCRPARTYIELYGQAGEEDAGRVGREAHARRAAAAHARGITLARSVLSRVILSDRPVRLARAQAAKGVSRCCN